MGLANLFAEAGFVVEECKPLFHIWPPRIYRLLARCGIRVFNILCCLYGRLSYYGLTPSVINQVRIVAKRPIDFLHEKPLESD
jgi:hypothetical protein